MNIKSWGAVEEEPHPEEPGYYLPHHAVVREGAQTTRTRVVFNASAAARGARSLNDTLLAGPSSSSGLDQIAHQVSGVLRRLSGRHQESFLYDRHSTRRSKVSAIRVAGFRWRDEGVEAAQTPVRSELLTVHLVGCSAAPHLT